VTPSDHWQLGLETEEDNITGINNEKHA